MTSKDRILNLLGLANRAGKIVSGEELVIKAMQQNKVKAVFIASDSSEATKNKFDKKCYFYKLPIIMEYNSSELSKSIGKEMRKIIAITDEGFYNTLKKYRGDDK